MQLPSTILALPPRFMSPLLPRLKVPVSLPYRPEISQVLPFTFSAILQIPISMQFRQVILVDS